MKLPELFMDRKAREAFKDKFELAMAVIVIGSFGYKKLKERSAPTLPSQENNE